MGLPGLNQSTKQRIKCLAQRHNAVPPVRLKLNKPQSRVEHSSQVYIIDYRQKAVLTLKAPITTAADDKFCDIFPNFFKEIRYDIS